MHARTGPDYAPDLLRAMPGALDGDAGDVTTGRYPVINTERRHPTRQRQVAGRDPGHEHSG